MVSRKRLLHYCDLFLNKYANLQTDMAQRIMFSIIPSLADPTQVALTQGVVDYKALKFAAYGRKNLIKYGVKAVLDELRHAPREGGQSEITYKGLLEDLRLNRFKETYQDKAMIPYGSGNLEGALDIAIDAFAQPIWDEGFGGKLWEDIARTLRQIVRLDRSIDEVQAKSNRTPEDQEKEIQLMRDIIVAMNVFDGLAHNSDSVMKNLVEEEVREKPGEYGSLSPQFQIKQDYRKLKRLMDAKELHSPAEVFRQILPTLEDSGDIHKFKDWVSKMRRSNEFKTSDPDIVNKLFIVHLRKSIIQTRGHFNKRRDKLKLALSDLQKLPADLFIEPITQVLDTIDLFDGAITEASIISQEIDENIHQFIMQYDEFAEMKPQLQALIRNPKNKLHGLVSSMQNIMLHHKTGEREDLLDRLSKILSMMNTFSYILDEI